VSSILNPVRGIRDAQRRQGKRVVNHAAENRRQLRRTQQLNRRKQEVEDRAPLQPLYKMSRFQNVPSKVFKATSSTQNQKPKKQFLRADHGVQSKSKRHVAPSHRAVAPFQRARKTKPKAAVPHAHETVRQYTETKQQRPQQQVDYLWNNAMDAMGKYAAKPNSARSGASAAKPPPFSSAASSNTQYKPKQPKQTGIAKTTNYGKVPAYIRKFNKEREQAAAQKYDDDDDDDDDACVLNFALSQVYSHTARTTTTTTPDRRIEDAQNLIPAGMRLMPEAERMQTLNTLQSSRKTLLTQLGSFPLTHTSFRREQAKAQIEERLSEIEDAIAKFSHKSVFVSMY
jgi:hypothetical protein